MHYPVIVFNNSHDPAERCAGGIVHARIGGLHSTVDSRKAPVQPGASSTRTRPERFEELYCIIASSQEPCTVQVSAECTAAVLCFMENYPGTIQDFKAVVLTTTPDKAAEGSIIKTFGALVRMGMSPSQARLLVVQAPRDLPVDEVVPALITYLKGQYPTDTPAVAVLHQSPAYSRVVEHQLPVPAILDRAIDFEVLLREARERGEDGQTLRQLSAKVLAQRALLAQRSEINDASHMLGLPAISQHAVLQPTLSDTEANHAAFSSSDATPALAVPMPALVQMGEVPAAGDRGESQHY